MRLKRAVRQNGILAHLSILLSCSRIRLRGRAERIVRPSATGCPNQFFDSVIYSTRINTKCCNASAANLPWRVGDNRGTMSSPPAPQFGPGMPHADERRQIREPAPGIA
jgi:hypothetical protein